MKLALQAIANISVDFYDKKYISINAKQLDRKTRFLSVTCYSHGELCPLNSGEHSAYIRYKKPDGYTVFNLCDINPKGKIIVELTDQMLAVAGICYTDLVVVNKGSAVVDKNTGEIVAINNSGILSSMPFYIDVFETAFENSEVESSYEYDGLNEALEKAEAEYSQVIRMAKSYAMGGTGERTNENTDNAKYYYEQSKKSATNSETYMNAASNSATAASKSAVDANTSAQNAQTYMGQAKTYMDNAQTSANASASSASAAATSEANASKSAEQSESFAITSQRYAVGGTGTAENEDKDNAKYYYEMALDNANSSLASATASANNASKAESSAIAAASSAESASSSATAASGSADAALASESNVVLSVEAAADSAMSAANSANAASEIADIVADSIETAKGYAETTQENMESAASSATAASTSADNASASADNAYNHYLRAEAVVNGLNGAFLPKGTITFSELATLTEEGILSAGYMYNISDDFITDETFRMGAGFEYKAGTNVYYTVDGQWDCFAGTTVVGVKGSAETDYKVGNVDISAENVGAIPSADIATVDEVKELLGIF